MWAEHAVEVRRSMTKRIDHPLVGRLEFDCQVLHVPDSDQRMVIYAAEPGTPTHSAFQRLRSLNRADDCASDPLGAHGTATSDTR